MKYKLDRGAIGTLLLGNCKVWQIYKNKIEIVSFVIKSGVTFKVIVSNEADETFSVISFLSSSYKSS